MSNCCRECEHWDQIPDHRAKEDAAACKLIVFSTASQKPLAYLSNNGAALLTRADFGCVEFKRWRGVYSTRFGGA